MPTATEGEKHDCIKETQQNVKPRPDLMDSQLATGYVIYIDGSAGKNDRGQNNVGYAITTQSEILKQGKLPNNCSAQAAELTALIEACKMFRGKSVTIYTDSQYAFGAAHHFCVQWKNRGYITSSGKSVAHKNLLKQLNDVIVLPKQIAVCKCAAHTTQTDNVSTGNRLADKAAKQAAGLLTADIQPEPTVLKHSILRDYQNKAPYAERQAWKKKRAHINNDLYIGLDNKPWLLRSLFKWAAELTHGPCHVSTGGMIHQVNQHYHTIGFNTYAQKFL